MMSEKYCIITILLGIGLAISIISLPYFTMSNTPKIHIITMYPGDMLGGKSLVWTNKYGHMFLTIASNNTVAVFQCNQSLYYVSLNSTTTFYGITFTLKTISSNNITIEIISANETVYVIEN